MIDYLRRLITRIRQHRAAVLRPLLLGGPWPGREGTRGPDRPGDLDAFVRAPRHFGPGDRSAAVALEEPLASERVTAIGRRA